MRAYIFILFLSLILGCSKDDKDPMRDWEEEGKPVQPAPKPGRVLVK